ncbi:MAG: light-regulated signal transduction histidine kinase (bacteriophytochrome) [Sphingobacteriales bacterium]
MLFELELILIIVYSEINELDYAKIQKNQLSFEMIKTEEVIQSTIEILNAIKNNNPSSTLEIISKKIDGDISLGFKDNGPSFPEKYIEGIFIPFETLHNKYEYKCTGIGQSTVKNLLKTEKSNLRTFYCWRRKHF